MVFAIIRCMCEQCVPGTLSPPPLHLGMRLTLLGIVDISAYLLLISTCTCSLHSGHVYSHV